MNTIATAPAADTSAPPAVDWTADPRFGDDDVRTGTLDELHALVRRRIAELAGPIGPALHGQVFRYERDFQRLTSFVNDDESTTHYETAHTKACKALYGDRWVESEDDEADTWYQEIWPHGKAGGDASYALPWIMRERTTFVDELLGEDDTAPVYRVAGLWPSGGKVVFSGPAKAGKSTAVGNIVRALADGVPLLGGLDDAGGFALEPLQLGETVCVLDFEMPRQMLRRWLGEQGIANPDRVHVASLRGRGSAFDVRDAAVRADWATYLRRQRTAVIVVEPIGPVLAALDIDEINNRAVRQFLAALDALVLESGASELLVVHHHGHTGERSRGAAAFRDWPDAEWRLVVQGAGGGREPGADAPRFFAATGRDVAVPETALAYDAHTRRLSLASGDRGSEVADRHAAAVVELVTADLGLSTRNLEERLKTAARLSTATARGAIGSAKAVGLIHVHPGPNRAQTHYLGSGCDQCSPTS